MTSAELHPEISHWITKWLAGQPNATEVGLRRAIQEHERAIERDALQWAAERMCGLCRRGEEPLRLYDGQMVHHDKETPTAHEVCEATQITYRIAQLTQEGS